MIYWRDCICCQRSSLGPHFTVAEPGAHAAVAICLRCSPHVSLSADGRLVRPTDCPDAVGPALRIVRGDDA